MPSKYTNIDPAYKPSDDENIILINDEDDNWKDGVYYGDASGGENTKYPALRRIGVGLACFNDLFKFGLHSNLPGSIQTVGRGELFALVLLVRYLHRHTVCEFVTDNHNVYKTFNKGPVSAMNSADCDLYQGFFYSYSNQTNSHNCKMDAFPPK